MIRRVYGAANGTTIEFTRDSGDNWEASVPWKEDGKYIVDIHAEDEAGNIAYMCRALFVISGHEIQGYMVSSGYQADGKTNDFSGLTRISEFLASLVDDKATLESHPEKYESKLKEGGYKIERAVCIRPIY